MGRRLWLERRLRHSRQRQLLPHHGEEPRRPPRKMPPQR